MASSIASLFGPSAEEIVYAKQQEDKALRQQQLQQGLAMQASPLAQQYYQAGYNLFSGLGGLFGKPMMDPRLTQAVKIRSILGDTGVKDLNDPDALDKLTEKFQEAGLGREALYFADRSNSLKIAQRNYDLAMAKYQRDITKRTLEKDFVVRGTGDTVYKMNDQYFNAKTDEPVSTSELVPRKDIPASKTPALAEQISIEQSFLGDTDFDDATKTRAANYLAQRAEQLLREPESRFKTLEEALKEANREAREQGVIRRKDPNAFLGDFNLMFRDDWIYDPSARIPYAPVDDTTRRDYTQVGK